MKLEVWSPVTVLNFQLSGIKMTFTCKSYSSLWEIVIVMINW